MTAEIRRASSRFTDRKPGRATWHSFSFGPHYDPERLGFGPMVCHDDHLLAEGQGFEPHPHRELDIVTWVASGAVAHTDSTGGSHTVSPGQLAILRAGTGIEHAELAAEHQTRFVQVWLTPLDDGLAPTYDVTRAPIGEGRFAELADLGPGRKLYGARLATGDTVTLPEAALRHLFVVTGALARSSLAEPIAAGDALLLTRTEHETPSPVSVTAAVPTDLLLWGFEQTR